MVSRLRVVSTNKGSLNEWALARLFIHAVQDRTNAIGLTISERRNSPPLRLICGLEFETQSGKIIQLLMDADFIHWLCQCLGGGARSQLSKIEGKPLTITEMVMIEELGRACCTKEFQGDMEFAFSGLGKISEVAAVSGFEGARKLEVSSHEGARLGGFAIDTLAAGLTSLSVTTSVTDSSAFRLTDFSGLWGMAKGRVTDLDFKVLSHWIHQEHPQVGAIILQLAGPTKAANILQHMDSHELLMQEIIYRMALAQDPSSIMAKAIATQAVVYLEESGATVCPRADGYVKAILLEMTREKREAFIKALMQRGSEVAPWLSQVEFDEE